MAEQREFLDKEGFDILVEYIRGNFSKQEDLEKYSKIYQLYQVSQYTPQVKGDLKEIANDFCSYDGTGSIKDIGSIKFALYGSYNVLTCVKVDYGGHQGALYLYFIDVDNEFNNITLYRINLIDGVGCDFTARTYNLDAFATKEDLSKYEVFVVEVNKDDLSLITTKEELSELYQKLLESENPVVLLKLYSHYIFPKNREDGDRANTSCCIFNYFDYVWTPQGSKWKEFQLILSPLDNVILKGGDFSVSDSPFALSSDIVTPIERFNGNNPYLTTKVNTLHLVEKVINGLTIYTPSVDSSATDRVLSTEVFFTTGDNPAIIIIGQNGLEVEYFAGYNIEPNKTYELNMMYNGEKWIVAYGVVE